MSRKGPRIGDREAIESLIEEMLRRPPTSPFDLRLRVTPFDPTTLRREMARRMVETELTAEGNLQIVQWLVELNPQNAAIHLLDCVVDAARPAAKRALAVIVLTSTHERELHRRMSTLSHEQQLEVMLAAQEWLRALQGGGTADARPPRERRPRPRRQAGKQPVESQPRVCRLKITLRHIRPQIWRRIEVRDDITLARLHRVLQVALGWTDSHLHEFRVGNTRYGVPDREWPDDTVSEKKITLRALIDRGVKRFQYHYDFGDDWQHEIVIERTNEPEPAADYPRCLTGKRACPPEDCGGPYGYQELLQTLANPNHPDHGDMRSWAGDFDSETFALDVVNRAFRRVR